MIQTDLYSFGYKTGTLVPWCKKCGEQNFYKDGKNSQRKQLYKCKKCNFRFVWCSDLPNKRFFTNIISFAVEMYIETGISLRKLANKLKKFFNIKVSYETIRQWIKLMKKTISPREIAVPTHWHADETYIKIKGKGFWLWIVYCKNQRDILAWRISKLRTFNQAKWLFKDALDIAGIRPESITTDGLYQYQAAIKKVMGWHWREYKRRHIIDSGIGKNAPIEEVNREVKRRIKWFRTFQSLEGAKAFFAVWFNHLNQLRFPTQGI